MQDFVTLISNVGFPIVMTLLMFKFSSETMESIKSALSENTIALEKLKECIESMKKDGDDNV